MMLPKDRVLAAFEHRPYDKVPHYQGGLSSRIGSEVLGRPDAHCGGGIQQWRESVALWNGPDAHREYVERCKQDAMDIIRKLDLDFVRPSYWRMGEKPTERLDEFTFVYGDRSKGAYRIMRVGPETELYQIVEQQPPKGETTVEAIEKSIEASERALTNYTVGDNAFADNREAMKVFGHERAVPGGGVGLGIPYKDPIWLELIALRPDLVGRYLDVHAAHAVKNIEFQAKINMGFRFLQGGGDFASNKGPFYSPRAFHELMLPRLKKISDACHKHGMFHLFASDGNLWPVADDLFGASGVDGFYEIDSVAGMDLGKLRDAFPHLTLMGNISSGVLHRGSKEDVVKETMYCLQVAKEKGSCIVGCSNQIVSQTPPENFWAMIETIQNNRDCR
ncbi:MAG: uroporphyrinogen decarboxylase family protein [Planctomycetota bacterium]